MTKKKIVFKEINKILNLTQQQSRQILEMLEKFLFLYIELLAKLIIFVKINMD